MCHVRANIAFPNWNICCIIWTLLGIYKISGKMKLASKLSSYLLTLASMIYQLHEISGSNLALTDHSQRLLTEAIKKYRSCVIHIVDVAGILEFEMKPRAPLIIDNWASHMRKPKIDPKPYRFDDSPTDSPELGLEFESLVVDRIGRVIPRTPKFHRSFCFLTCLLISHLSLYLQNKHTAAEVQTILRQDFTFGIPFHMPSSGKAMSRPMRLYPESLIVFHDEIRLSVTLAVTTVVKTDNLFPFTDHLPPILVLVGSFAARKKRAISLGYYPGCTFALIPCYYCLQSKPPLPLSCEWSLTQLENIVGSWADQAPWQSFASGSLVPFELNAPCPFSLRSSTTTGQCSAILSMVAGYAFGSLNVTSWPKYAPKNWFYRSPGLHRGSSRYSSGLEVFALDPPTKFGLITSDGLVSSSDWWPAGLLEPLPLSVWFLIVVGVLLVSTALGGLEQVNMRDIADFTFVVSRVLVLQAVLPFRRENGMRAATGLSKKLIWATWLLTALLITSSYSGVFKSNYVFEPEYSRNWTRWLDMEANLRLYFASLQAMTDEDWTYNPECSDEPSGGFASRNNFDLRKSCTARDKYEALEALYGDQDSIKASEELKRRYQILKSYLVFHISDLPAVINADLSSPGKVFVSPMPCFDSDWEYFRTAMRQQGSKFTRRFDPSDTTLDHVLQYSFTAGLHSWHEKLVPRRLKSLVSSGVFQLWTRWEQLRLEFACINAGGETTVGYISLSMTGSDLCLVFNLFGLLLLASFITFTFECSARLLAANTFGWTSRGFNLCRLGFDCLSHHNSNIILVKPIK